MTKSRILAGAFALLLALTGLYMPAGATESISNTQVETTVLATLNKTLNLPGAVSSAQVTYQAKQVFANGTGSGQAAAVWHDERTLTASSSESLQLTTSGGLIDGVGGTLNLSFVKAIIIKAAAGNTNNVVVGGLATNCFIGPFGSCAVAASQTIQPGGYWVAVAPNTGWAVTASTGDLLKVANSSSGTSVTYDIIVIGY